MNIQESWTRHFSSFTARSIIASLFFAVTIAGGVLLASSSVATAQQATNYNWYPGYYALMAADSNTLNEKLNNMDDPRSAAFTGYQIRYLWNDMETAPNDYSAGFSIIDTDLANAASRGKKLLIMLQYKRFDGLSPVPADLAAGSGPWCSGRFCGYLNIDNHYTTAMLWNPAVSARLKAWITATVQHVANGPYANNVAGILFPETSIGTADTTILAEAGYDPFKYMTGIQTNLLAVTDTTPKFIAIYYHEGGFVSMDGTSPKAGEVMGDWMLTHPRIGTGTPDAQPLNPKGTQHPCANTKYTGKIVCAPSVQAPDYALVNTDSIESTFNYIFSPAPNGLYGSFPSFSYSVGAGPNAFTFTDVSEYIKTHPVPNTTPPWPMPTGAISPTPPVLFGDLNGDNVVNITDLGLLLGNFGESPATYVQGNIAGNDTIVNIVDLSTLLASFGNSIAVTSTPTPIITALITNLTDQSISNYSAQTNLQTGSLQYVNQTHTYNIVPTALVGSSYIQTANDVEDRSSTSASFITFNVNAAATVYVAYDSRNTTVPSWLTSEFTLSSDTLRTDNGVVFNLYQRSYSSGQTVVLGGNANSTNRMYSVIVKQTTGTGPTPTPTTGTNPTLTPTRTPTPTVTRTPTPTPGGATSTPVPTTSNGGISTDANLKVAFVGDGGASTNFQKVLDLIKAEQADIAIHSGDFDYGDGVQKWMNMINTTLGSNFPYLGSDGNHDNWLTDVPPYKDFFESRVNMLNTQSKDLSEINTGNYSLTYRGLKMVFTGDSEDVGYLNQSLTGDNHIWKICSWHNMVTLVSLGFHTNDSAPYTVYEECRRQGAIIVDGHNHTYTRTKTLKLFSSNASLSTDQFVDTQQHPLTGGVPGNPNSLLVAPGKTFAVTVGTGGNSVNTYTDCEAQYPYGPASTAPNLGCSKYVYASVHSRVQRDLSPENDTGFGALFITFNVNGNPNQAQGYFKDVGGQITDTFTITKQ